MVITTAEFENDVGKYLSLVSTEDIFITENGEQIAKLSNPKRVEMIKSLFGLISENEATSGL